MLDGICASLEAAAADGWEPAVWYPPRFFCNLSYGSWIHQNRIVLEAGGTTALCTRGYGNVL